MGGFNPVEMLDYVFDRYAFLGISRQATVEEIRAAIRAKRVENHSDNLGRAGAEVKDTAARMNRLIADCETVLLHEERKWYYDMALADFSQNRPQAVCDDGVPRIVLGEMHFNLPVLTGVAEEEAQEDLLAHARMLSGHDAKKLDTLRRLYAADPVGDLKDMLVAALEAALLYFDTVEEDAWQQVGISGKKAKLRGNLSDPANYAEDTLDELARTVDEELPPRFAATLALTFLGVRTPLLLPPPEKAAAGLPARMEDVTVNHLMAQVRKTMDERRELVAEAARQKQAVLAEMAEVMGIEWLTAGPRRPGPFTIMLMVARNDGEEPVAFVALESDDDDPTRLTGNEAHPALGQTAEAIMGMALERDTIGIRFIRETGQPMMMVGPAIKMRRREMGLPPMAA